MNQYALIVAGGQGTRMKSDVPKQFLELQGKPVLLHTLEAFYTFDLQIKLILVLPEDQIDAWKKIIDKDKVNIKYDLVIGGNTRFASVKNGLSKIKESGLVAIHDGVRPLVDHTTIKSNFETAHKHGNAVTSVDLKDSIRMKTEITNRSVNRDDYKIVQTPQTFDVKIIQKAYQQAYDEKFTDDASVFERMGGEIKLVEGSYSNLKITTKEDLIIASALMSRTEKA